MVAVEFKVLRLPDRNMYPYLLGVKPTGRCQQGTDEIIVIIFARVLEREAEPQLVSIKI